MQGDACVWGQPERCLNVFISSPSDTQVEREAAKAAVLEVHTTVAQQLGLALSTSMWEGLRPGGDDVMESQIAERLRSCDLFILVFSRRFGSSPSGQKKYQSGTEEEYEWVSRQRATGEGRPEIFIYFKQVVDPDTLNDPGPELQKIIKFKTRASKKHRRFYKEYRNAEEFKLIVKDHLIQWLLDIHNRLNDDPEIKKKRTVLETFFSMNGSRNGHRGVDIVHPPLTSEEIAKSLKVSIEDFPYGDKTHLLPYMVLEDSYAIHKIIESLNLIGCTDIQTITTNLYRETDRPRGDRIFLCFPRNAHAQQVARSHPDARFRIVEEGNTRAIVWTRLRGERVIVRSPQSEYLTRQRVNQKKWDGNCYCVDFGVLARFGRANSNDFIIFGIRGLGTWGAAWHIDHGFRDIAGRLDPKSKTFQALLKVTYSDHRIRKVEDVSDQPQDFFDHENDGTYIEEELRDRPS